MLIMIMMVIMTSMKVTNGAITMTIELDNKHDR